MLYTVGLENNAEGRSIAWALEYPGCFAYGTTGDRALATLPEAIWEYAAWIGYHCGTSWIDPGEIEFFLDGSWDCYCIDEKFDLAEEGYEVNAWFRHDWKTLSEEEIKRAIQLLEWSRLDLLELVENLEPQVLSSVYPNERWDIAGILRHVGGAEWWYMHRLGLAFPQDQVPKEPFERLAVVRSHLLNILPGLTGSKTVLGVDGEFWSPRKLLRRAIWHERDHTAHIRKLLCR